MKIIKFKLSEDSINQLISKIDKLEKIAHEALLEAVEEKVIEACQVISDNTYSAGDGYHEDTGQLKENIDFDINEKKAEIRQWGETAFAVEFGYGIRSREFPYPDGTKIPAGHPLETTGYTYVPTNPSSRWYHHENPNKEWSAKGQGASAQMYQGSMYLRDKLPETIKQKVRGALSKI